MEAVDRDNWWLDDADFHEWYLFELVTFEQMVNDGYEYAVCLHYGISGRVTYDHYYGGWLG